MSKNIVKKTARPLNPKPGVNRPRTTYLAEQRDTDAEQGRPKQADAAAAGALKTPPAVVRVEFSPSTSTVPSKPPNAARPSSVPPPGAANPSPATAPQKAPITASAPKIVPAAASLPPKAPVQSAAPSSPEKSAVLAQVPKPAEPKTVSIVFALHGPDAKQVSLCGEFNGWSRIATPMKRQNDGHWKTTVALAPGRYQYKFVVDGEWLPDPRAHESVWNHHGTLNSVIEVRA